MTSSAIFKAPDSTDRGRLLARVAEDVSSQRIDRYLVRDAQRAIESIEVLVRIHVAQEEEIYEAVQAQ